MFTGIIEELGKIHSLQKEGNQIRLTIQAVKVLQDVKKGDSIAIDGICLTVEEFTSDSFTFYASPETIQKTSLKISKCQNTVQKNKPPAKIGHWEK